MREALATAGEHTLESGGTVGFPGWAQRLGDLASQLTEPERGEVVRHALKVAHQLGPEGITNYRDSALACLIPLLSALSPWEALEEVERIKIDITRARMLVIIAPQLPVSARSETLHRALEFARKLDARFKGRVSSLEPLTEVFISVALQLDQPSRQETLREAESISEEIHDPMIQAKALVALSSNLTEPRKHRLVQIALEMAQRTQDPEDRAATLAEMMPLLSGRTKRSAYRLAFTAARQISFAERRAQVLTTLALQSGIRTRQKILRDALRASRDVVYVDERARIQVQLVPHLSAPLLKKALDLARDKPDYSGLEVFTALIPRLPDNLLPEALAVARGYTEQWVRAVALSSVAGRLSDARQRRMLLEKALQLGRTVGFYDFGATVLAAVAHQLSGRRQTAVLKEAIQLELEYLTEAQYDEENSLVDSKLLVSIIPMLSVRLRRTFLSNVFQIPYELVRVDVLVALIPHLSTSSLRKVLEHVEASELRDANRAKILVALLHHAPKQLLEVVRSKAGRIRDLSSRALVLTTLIKYVPENKRRKVTRAAWTVARKITEDAERARALVALLPNLSGQEWHDALSSAINSALRIENTESRGQALGALVSYWEKLNPSKLHKSWSQALHALSGWDRPDMLLALQQTAPLIKTMGEATTMEVGHSIERVGSWWP